MQTPVDVYSFGVICAIYCSTVGVGFLRSTRSPTDPAVRSTVAV